MHPALWIAKTGLEAQTTDLAVISNNTANAGTVGFKKSRAAFEDLFFYQNLRQPGSQSSQDTKLPAGLELGTGVAVVATQKFIRREIFQTSDNQLDMAIQGKGFFQVLLPDGTTAYTRAGNFTLDENGQIVTMGSGYVVQPTITVPNNTTSLDVAIDGTISAQLPAQAAPSILGNMQLANFVNPTGLQPIGENLFLETGSSGTPIIGTPGLDGLGLLRGGQLETSNVSTVEELVSMIETQRTYETNAKVLSAVDQMLQFVNQTI